MRHTEPPPKPFKISFNYEPEGEFSFVSCYTKEFPRNNILHHISDEACTCVYVCMHARVRACVCARIHVCVGGVLCVLKWVGVLCEILRT